MNHFSEEVNKDILLNIGTGKSSKQEAAEILLNVNKIGQEARKGFIISCIKDPKRFEECISRHKILNFTSKGASYSLTGANNKLMAVEMARNFFGSILSWLFKGKLIWQRFCHFHLHQHHYYTFAQEGNNIQLLFDKIVSPSIKDRGRDSRSGYQERGSQYQIQDPIKEDQVTG